MSNHEVLAAMVVLVVALVFTGGLMFLLGHYVGGKQARIQAFMSLIDYAAFCDRGHPAWSILKPSGALLKAGALIGGDDIVTARRPQPVSQPSSVLSKGSQA
jgi:hypothetical protein